MCFIERKVKNSKGFTFIEVMVAITILSVGILMIYKAFFISLEYIRHLTYRAYAINLLNNRVVLLQKVFELEKEIPFNQREDVEEVTIDKKKVRFRFNMDLASIDYLNNIYQMDLTLSWSEGSRRKQLSRSTYIANFDRFDIPK